MNIRLFGLAVAMYLTGAMGCAAPPERDTPLGELSSELQACDAEFHCLPGFTCQAGTCRPICLEPGGPSNCRGWPMCCLGYVNGDGSLTQPYCATTCTIP